MTGGKFDTTTKKTGTHELKAQPVMNAPRPFRGGASYRDGCRQQRSVSLNLRGQD
jgi:hypothetical protein